MSDWTRTESRAWTNGKKTAEPEFSDELEDRLSEAHDLLSKGAVILFLFEDMADVNEHFQAALDWFKNRGNRMRRRYQQGAYMQSGMVYFVGADTFELVTELGFGCLLAVGPCA